MIDRGSSACYMNYQSIGKCDLLEVCRKYPTPFYVYDIESVEDLINEIKKHLESDIKLYYAVKANPNREILKRVRQRVDGADISSGGELLHALQAGFPADSLSFAGPGKTDEDLWSAVRKEIGTISIESLNELRRVEAIAAHSGTKANVSLRINPSRMLKGFAMKMGGGSSQFGIDEEDCMRFFSVLKQSKNCNFVGIHVYSGTQCLKAEVLLENFDNTMRMANNLIQKTDVRPKVINFGGGFGVPYFQKEDNLDYRAVCSTFSTMFGAFKKENNLSELIGILELGRFLMAESGVYVAKVIDVKKSRGKKYCVLDGGMNHHLPASGNFGQVIRRNFRMVNISNGDVKAVEPVTVVGPLCTAMDKLGDQVMIPKPEVGHYIGILNSGAYGYTASPLMFLSHKTPMELMVTENEVIKVIRESVLL